MEMHIGQFCSNCRLKKFENFRTFVPQHPNFDFFQVFLKFFESFKKLEIFISFRILAALPRLFFQLSSKLSKKFQTVSKSDNQIDCDQSQ